MRGDQSKPFDPRVYQIESPIIYTSSIARPLSFSFQNLSLTVKQSEALTIRTVDLNDPSINVAVTRHDDTFAILVATHGCR